MRSWLSVWLVLGCACGAETEGQSIAIRWDLGGASGDAPAREFTTDTGWQVSLDEARLALESVFAIAPANTKAGAIARLAEFLVPVAHAHGGHDEASGRRIRAELLDPLTLDVLAAQPERLRGMEAEAGPVETMKIALARSDQTRGEGLHGFQAYVRGSAERDGERIEFQGGLHFADEEPARRVETRVEFTLSDGGALQLVVQPSEWLREAQFDRLPAAEGDEPRVIGPDNQVGRAWAIGVRSPDAFGVTWKAED